MHDAALSWGDAYHAARTERNVRIKYFADDFLRISRNDLRSISQRIPSESAVMEAARGLEYISASSPKQGFCKG